MEAKKKQPKKFLKKKHLLLFVIALLFAAFISYPYLQTSKTSLNPEPSQLVKIENTVVYPNSKEFLINKEDRRTTVNYQAPVGTAADGLINYFTDNMPKIGWTLEARTQYEAIFVNGSRRFRVWIIYQNTSPDQPLDYYIDYTY